jgi:hypothetical protein
MVSCLMTVLTQLEDVFYQRFFILIDVQENDISYQIDPVIKAEKNVIKSPSFTEA